MDIKQKFDTSLSPETIDEIERLTPQFGNSESADEDAETKAIDDAIIESFSKGSLFRVSNYPEKLDQTIIHPYRVIVDGFFSGELEKANPLEGMMISFLATLIRRYFRETPEAQDYFASIKKLSSLADEGKSIEITTNYATIDKRIFFEAMKKITMRSLEEHARDYNDVRIYQVRDFNTECKRNILYTVLKDTCPGLLEAAKAANQQVYVTSKFNFAVGPWINDHVIAQAIKGERISEHFELEGGLKLQVLNNL